MTELEKNILHMQAYVFRMAQVKWGISAKECAEIFREYGFLEHIRECYDYLHLSCYENALLEIEDYLKRRGIFVGIEPINEEY